MIALLIKFILYYLVACAYDKWLSRRPHKMHWIGNIFVAAFGVFVSILAHRWLFE